MVEDRLHNIGSRQPYAGVEFQLTAISAYRHKAQLIGTQHAHAMVGQPRQYVAMRMSVGIFKACRDDGEERARGVEQRGRAGRLAAVMRHF